MRKTICALTLTILLSGAAMAGEIPNGGNTPPPPPPPPQGREFAGATPNGQDLLQTSDETATDIILNLIQSMLSLY
jgi:hypothetical protein